jgi:hypothetical protein
VKWLWQCINSSRTLPYQRCSSLRCEIPPWWWWYIYHWNMSELKWSSKDFVSYIKFVHCRWYFLVNNSITCRVNNAVKTVCISFSSMRVTCPANLILLTIMTFVDGSLHYVTSLDCSKHLNSEWESCIYFPRVQLCIPRWSSCFCILTHILLKIWTRCAEATLHNLQIIAFLCTSLHIGIPTRKIITNESCRA